MPLSCVIGSSPRPARLLYVVNIPRFFVSHRLPLALAARRAGYEVHVATSDHDPDSVERITAAGLPFHPLPLSQHGLNLLSELKAFGAIRRLYRDLEPQLVHHVTIKPVLYGGIAARLTGTSAVIGAMSGLGYVFIGAGMKPALLRALTRPLFKLALGGQSTRMIFQNPDDRRVFVDAGFVRAEKAALIPGSGVDTERFSPRPEPVGEAPTVLFAGRLLWQKGVGEFVDLARRLKGMARFVIAGYEETTNPSSVPASQLSRWQADGSVVWLGKRDDMPEVFARSNVVCLPSSYGEGIPKVLIEAASCGRAIVTTDTPGCREIVRHGCNGLLVPKHDGDALAGAVSGLIQNPEMRARMGREGRDLAVKHFSFEHVAAETFALYRLVRNEAGLEPSIPEVARTSIDKS